MTTFENNNTNSTHPSLKSLSKNEFNDKIFKEVFEPTSISVPIKSGGSDRIMTFTPVYKGPIDYKIRNKSNGEILFQGSISKENLRNAGKIPIEEDEQFFHMIQNNGKDESLMIRRRQDTDEDFLIKKAMIFGKAQYFFFLLTKKEKISGGSISKEKLIQALLD